MLVNYLKYINNKRLANTLRLGYSYLASNITRKPIMLGKPFAASIEPANYCNLHCPQCPTGMGVIKKDRGLLDFKNFTKIVNGLLPEISYLNLYFQGEPFLNPELYKMISYAKDHKIYTCISTNGQFLSPQNVEKLKENHPDRLIICIDGAKQESYEKYRVGASFNKLLDGIKLCVKAGLSVELQCLILSSNEDEIADIKHLAKELGVKKLVFKKAQFYNNYLMPQKAENRRYKLQDDGFVVAKKQKNRCFRIWTSVVINTFGEVVPCCFDKDCSHSWGSCLALPFSEIWLGERAKKFRQQILSCRNKFKICTNCTE